MGVNPGIELFDKKGLRTDGRKTDEIRPLSIEAGVLHRADGSAYLEWGNNKVMAAVYGPREYNPRRFQQADKCVIRCKYNMAAFSTSDRKRPGPDRRSQEIGKVIADAFENVVLTERFPRGVIDINMEILQADAGTRCAALTAATVALADAGIPMKGLVAALAAGKAGGVVCVDLDGPEDNFGEADLPIAVNMTTGEIVLLQMDGHLTDKEFDQALDMAYAAAKDIYDVQRAALEKRFAERLEQMEAEAPDDVKGLVADYEAEDANRDRNERTTERAREAAARSSGPRGGGRGGPKGGGGRGGPRGGSQGGPRGGGGGRGGPRGDSQGGPRGGGRGGPSGGSRGGSEGGGRSSSRSSSGGGRGRGGPRKTGGDS